MPAPVAAYPATDGAAYESFLGRWTKRVALLFFDPIGHEPLQGWAFLGAAGEPAVAPWPDAGELRERLSDHVDKLVAELFKATRRWAIRAIDTGALTVDAIRNASGSRHMFAVVPSHPDG